MEASAPGLCPIREGDWGPGTFCLVVGAWVGAGGRPWLHSEGSSPVYLVPLWALFSEGRSRMGWVLLSSKVWPSGLSGALLPWSSSFRGCQVTRICTPLLGPSPRRRYWIAPSHQIQSPVWSLRKGCGTFAPFLNSGYDWVGAVLVGRGRMMRMLGPGWVVVVVGGRMMRILGLGLPGGSRGCGGLGGFCPTVFSGLLEVGGGCACFLSRSLWCDWSWWGWGGVGLEEGVRSMLSLSGHSAAVCMVAFAWLRVRLTSLRTVSGGCWAMAVRRSFCPEGGGDGRSS